MIFSSYIFLLAFLPLCLAGYFALAVFGRSLQKYFLICASLLFYAWYEPRSLIIFACSIGANYLVLRLMTKYRSCPGREKLLFLLGLIFNIFLLGFYKYLNFFIDSANALFGLELAMRKLLLPLGISFFTFQQLLMLVRVHRGEEQPGSFSDYCLFISFFPQLVSGPILLHSEIQPQFADPGRRRFDADNFASGLFIFCIGLFKKTVVADSLALYVGNGFALSDPGLAAAWCSSLCYTFQIYFDFSGYSDMAVGIARMFNYDIPHNFLSPYKSGSITEFWRRWHITLGRALSLCVYRPLGGSRKGLARTCLNLFITFMISGIWHGAAWTFVLWGALHGLIIALERVFAPLLEKLPRLLRRVLCFLTVNFLWVFFRAESWSQAMAIFRGMFSFDNIAIYQLGQMAFDGVINFPAIFDYALISASLAVCLLVVFRCRSSTERLAAFKPSLPNLISSAALLCLSLLCMSRESIFIYFNF